MACDFQRLLTLGNYVVVSDLVSEAAEHLDSTVELVTKAMAIFRGRSWKGCSAAIDYTKFNQAASQPTFRPEQLRSYSQSSCLPRFRSGDMAPGTYANSHFAKCATLLHFLLNIGVVDKPQGWANKFFVTTDYRGFLLLIPSSGRESESICFATAFLYISDDGKQSTIMCSMIQDDGMGDKPFACGTIKCGTIKRQKKETKHK